MLYVFFFQEHDDRTGPWEILILLFHRCCQGNRGLWILESEMKVKAVKERENGKPARQHKNLCSFRGLEAFLFFWWNCSFESTNKLIFKRRCMGPRRNRSSPKEKEWWNMNCGLCGWKKHITPEAVTSPTVQSHSAERASAYLYYLASSQYFAHLHNEVIPAELPKLLEGYGNLSNLALTGFVCK